MTDHIRHILGLAHEKLSAICPRFAGTISDEQVSRLKHAGYMSSQGVHFQCSTCDWFNKGYCHHKEIESMVQYNGCCNYWTHDGVHG